MRTLLRHDTPVAVRVVLAGFACLVTLYGALLVAMQADHPSARTVVAASGIALIGLIALSAAATSDRSRLPLYMTMGLTVLFSIAILMGLPFPPRASSIGSQMALLAVLALIAAAILSMGGHPGRAFLLLMLLATVGGLLALSAITVAVTIVLPPAARFPVWEVAVVIGASLAAGWHDRVLRAPHSSRPLPGAV